MLKDRKGIILAGGNGTRLMPVTRAISKQLLPVYDKPMIYYPLSVLILAGVREIAVITRPQDGEQFHNLLGNGEEFGVEITYLPQQKPGGIAESLIIAKRSHFLDFDDPCALILGDNIFSFSGMQDILLSVSKDEENATIFGYFVRDLERYGVAEIDSNGNVISLEEKPEKPKGDLAVTGLYFLPSDAAMIASKLVPSKRGELEILDVLQNYMDGNRLKMRRLDSTAAWFDSGTFESLLQSSCYIHSIRQRGSFIGDPAFARRISRSFEADLK